MVLKLSGEILGLGSWKVIRKVGEDMAGDYPWKEVK